MSFKDNYYKVSDTTCDYCDSSNCKKEEMYHFFKDTNTHSEHTTDYIVCLDCSVVEYYDFDEDKEVSELSNLENVNNQRECHNQRLLTQDQLDMNIILSDLRNQFYRFESEMN